MTENVYETAALNAVRVLLEIMTAEGTRQDVKIEVARLLLSFARPDKPVEEAP